MPSEEEKRIEEAVARERYRIEIKNAIAGLVISVQDIKEAEAILSESHIALRSSVDALSKKIDIADAVAANKAKIWAILSGIGAGVVVSILNYVLKV